MAVVDSSEIIRFPESQSDELICAVCHELLIISTNTYIVLRLKNQLVDTFEIIEPGLLHFTLGLQLFPLSKIFHL